MIDKFPVSLAWFPVFASMLACGASSNTRVPSESPEAAKLVLSQDARPAVPSPEARVQARLDALMQDAQGLRAFVEQIPKGADLHHHLSGGMNMEKLIAWATGDQLCLDPASYAVGKGPCKGKSIPFERVRTDKDLHARVLAAWSLEGQKSRPVIERHKHFFDSFEKFDPAIDLHSADAIADVMSIAGKNHQTYLELMRSLGSWEIGVLAQRLMPEKGVWTESYLLEKRAKLIANPTFRERVAKGAMTLRNEVAKARSLLHCDAPQADPGCKVDVRFVTEACRFQDPKFVFGQWVYGFELAQKEPLIVGVNLVAPEEEANSLKFYDADMFGLGVLAKMNRGDSSRKPVHISLHAGELIPEVLPSTPEGQHHLEFHIRHAIEVGQAERIGHGTDILREAAADPSSNLLASMKKKDVLVEICLSSSAALLGYEGDRHPLNTLVAKGVPVALATDDQGIFRTNITDDWMLAIQRNKLDYRTLKKLARASVEHSFLPGKSLWTEPNRYERMIAACAADAPDAQNLSHGKESPEPSPACKEYLGTNERAALEWKFERELATFESTMS